MIPTARRIVPVEPLSAAAFAPFGVMLGGTYPAGNTTTAYTHPGSDFWHVHDFDAGAGGRPEVLWVNYRDSSLQLRALEAHWLTDQAIVPLGNGLVHVVCLGRPDRPTVPDLASLRAFEVPAGQGMCMRAGCWHASFVLRDQVTCMMLTRSSTTLELVAHLHGEVQATETSIVALPELAHVELGRPG